MSVCEPSTLTRITTFKGGGLWLTIIYRILSAETPALGSRQSNPYEWNNLAYNFYVWFLVISSSSWWDNKRIWLISWATYNFFISYGLNYPNGRTLIKSHPLNLPSSFMVDWTKPILLYSYIMASPPTCLVYIQFQTLQGPVRVSWRLIDTYTLLSLVRGNSVNPPS